jgi:hypothetical protein
MRYVKLGLCVLIVAAGLSASAVAVTLQSPRSSFLGGELSPLILNRGDLPQYEAGLKTLENGLVIDVGAVMRRPGSVYVATEPGPAHLETFIYDEADAYVLAFTDGKLRFYRDNGIILDPNTGSPYEVNTPYGPNDIAKLALYQSADVCYIVSTDGTYSPRKLSRLAHASWTLEDFNDLVLDGPFRALNTSSTCVRVSDVNNPVDPAQWVHLISDANIFQEEHVGSLWKLQHVLANQRDAGTFSGVADGNEVVAGVGAPYGFAFTSAAFQGTIKLQAGYEDYVGGTQWVDEYTVTNVASGALDVNDTGISNFGVEAVGWPSNVKLRVVCSALTSGTVDYEITVDSYLHTGIVRIYEYGSPNDVNVVVTDRCGIADANTTMWAEGAWNNVRGYPTAVTGHFGRLVFAQGLTIYWSAVEDYEKFRAGTNDDEAFAYTLSQARQNATRWMVGERSQNLILGTLGKIMELRPLDELGGFTPTNPPKVGSTVASTVGMAQPALAENVILFTDRTGKRVYEMLYDSGEQTIVAPDLTILASHITGTGISQMAWQRSPYPILWCVRNDGDMATLYYNRTYKVGAWSRQVTDGDYTSVAVVPTEGGNDRVWTVVKRTLDGNDVYYVEYFHDLDLEAEIEDAFYVDSGLTWDGGGLPTANNISAVTKANPAKVTLTAWPTHLVAGVVTNLADGDNVRITDVGGMTQLNDQVFIADDCNVGAKTLTLDTLAAADLNSVPYTAYSSGGRGKLQIVENTFADLSHLEGKTVTVLADGFAVGTEVVDANAVTLDDYYGQVAIGLPYTTTITPSGIDIIGNGESTLPFLKRETAVYLNVYRTAGGQYGPAVTNLRDIVWPSSTSSQVASVAELYSGPMVLRTFGGSRRDAGYTLIQADPLPFVLKTMLTIYETTP